MIPASEAAKQIGTYHEHLMFFRRLRVGFLYFSLFGYSFVRLAATASAAAFEHVFCSYASHMLHMENKLQLISCISADIAMHLHYYTTR